MLSWICCSSEPLPLMLERRARSTAAAWVLVPSAGRTSAAALTVRTHTNDVARPKKEVRDEQRNMSCVFVPKICATQSFQLR